jgi:hypothetical protein
MHVADPAAMAFVKCLHHRLGLCGIQNQMLPGISSPERQQARWLALLLHPPLRFELFTQRVSLDGAPVLLRTTNSFLPPEKSVKCGILCGIWLALLRRHLSMACITDSVCLANIT